MLFDCSVRQWYKKDIKELQKWIDKTYRYVWTNKNEPPLRQMERMGTNMQHIKNQMGIKSIEWKIEKTVLERLGHVMRMENSRLPKIAVMGWNKELEGFPKRKGRKRKTMLYWKRKIIEAGLDWTQIEPITADREGWKEKIKERIDHLEKYEREKGNLVPREERQNLVRNIPPPPNKKKQDVTSVKGHLRAGQG